MIGDILRKLLLVGAMAEHMTFFNQSGIEQDTCTIACRVQQLYGEPLPTLNRILLTQELNILSESSTSPGLANRLEKAYKIRLVLENVMLDLGAINGVFRSLWNRRCTDGTVQIPNRDRSVSQSPTINYGRIVQPRGPLLILP